MKKTLIIAAVSSMLFAACSNEAKKEATTVSESMSTSIDTTVVNTDSTTVDKDPVAVDSAQAAHDHTH